MEKRVYTGITIVVLVAVSLGLLYLINPILTGNVIYADKNFTGIPLGFVPYAGYSHNIGSEGIYLWTLYETAGARYLYTSTNGINFSNYSFSSKWLPYNFYAKATYYDSFKDQIVAWGTNGIYIYNETTNRFWGPYTPSDKGMTGLPVGFVPNRGFSYGTVRAGDRISLWKLDWNTGIASAYISSDGRTFTKYDSTLLGLTKTYVADVEYYDPFTKNIYMWANDASSTNYNKMYAWREGAGTAVATTMVAEGFTGIPTTSAPVTGYYDKVRNKVVIWISQTPYESTDGKNFKQVGTGRDVGTISHDISRKVGSCTGNNCPPFGTDATDVLYCPSTSSCMYQLDCYGWHRLFLLGGENVFCSDNNFWMDLDTSQSFCTGQGFNWTRTGEDAIIGEYDSLSSVECCGDDTGEYLIKGTEWACCNNPTDFVYNGKCYSHQESIFRKSNEIVFNPGVGVGYYTRCSGNNCVSFSSSPITESINGDRANCLSKNYCVYNKQCYAKGTFQTFNNENVGCYDYLNTTVNATKWRSNVSWVDADFYPYVCTNIIGIVNGWAKDGESFIIGEYDSISSYECCGDDEGESLILGTDGTRACCSSGNKVVLNRVCMDSGGTGLPDAIPDAAYYDKFNDRIIQWYGNRFYSLNEGATEYVENPSNVLTGVTLGFAPISGFLHKMKGVSGTGVGRINLWGTESDGTTYLYASSDGRIFTKSTSISMGLPNKFKVEKQYYDPFKDKIYFWNETAMFVYNSSGNVSQTSITKEGMTGLPANLIPTLAYYDKLDNVNKVVLWNEDNAYISTNGFSFTEYTAGTGTEDLPDDFSPTIGYYHEIGDGGVNLYFGTTAYSFTSESELFGIVPPCVGCDPYKPECPESDADVSCVLEDSCTHDNSLEDDYFCRAGSNYVCCNIVAPTETCDELDGQVCVSGEVCSTNEVEASDTSFCCTGTCEPASADMCEDNSGICREECGTNEEEDSSYVCDGSNLCCFETASEVCEDNDGTCKASCGSGESQDDSYTCDNFEDVCCTACTGDDCGTNWWWVILLIIGIILVAIAIVVVLIIMEKKKGKKKPGPPTGPFGPRPMFPSNPGMGTIRPPIGPMGPAPMRFGPMPPQQRPQPLPLKK